MASEVRGAQPQKAASSSGARADAEVVGASFLRSILLGDERKLELRTVDHELLDVAHAQHERRPAWAGLGLGLELGLGLGLGLGSGLGLEVGLGVGLELGLGLGLGLG